MNIAQPFPSDMGQGALCRYDGSESHLGRTLPVRIGTTRIQSLFHFIFAYYSPMGGGSGSTARMRLSGEICCSCSNRLTPPHTGRETYCDKCKPSQKVVYAAFERRSGWHVVFFDSYSQRRLGRELLLQDDERVYELAERGHALRDLADKQALEAAIRGGKGGLFLRLTNEQYRKLEGRK